MADILYVEGETSVSQERAKLALIKAKGNKIAAIRALIYVFIIMLGITSCI